MELKIAGGHPCASSPFVFLVSSMDTKLVPGSEWPSLAMPGYSRSYY